MRCLLLPKRGLSNHEKSVSTRSCIIKNLFHSLDFFFDLSEVRASCVPKASRPICSQIIFLDHVLLGEFNHVLSVNINSIKFFPFSSAPNLDFFSLPLSSSPSLTEESTLMWDSSCFELIDFEKGKKKGKCYVNLSTTMSDDGVNFL